MTIFLKWLAQCHHLNQSRKFNVAINFPVYRWDQDFILDGLLLPRDSQETPREQQEIPKSEGFYCEVRLPPLDVLSTIGAKELVEIRAHLGNVYLSDLRRWQAAPSPDNLEMVKNSLVEYCNALSARYDDKILEHMLVSYSDTPRINKPAVTLASTIGGGLGLPVGLFIAGFKSLYALYQRSQMKGSAHAKLQPTTRGLEITLAESRAHCENIPK